MLRFTPSAVAFRMLRLAIRRAFGRPAPHMSRFRPIPSLHTLESREAPGETFAAVFADADFLGLGGALLDVDSPQAMETAAPHSVLPPDPAILEASSSAPDAPPAMRSSTESPALTSDSVSARHADLPEPGEQLIGDDLSLPEDSGAPTTAGGDTSGGAGATDGPPAAGEWEAGQPASASRPEDLSSTAGSIAASSQSTTAPAPSTAKGATTASPPTQPTPSAPITAKTPRVWVEAVDGPTGRGFRIWRDGSSGNLSVRYQLTGPTGSAASPVVITDGNRSTAIVVPGGADVSLTLLGRNGYLVAATSSAQLTAVPVVTPTVSAQAETETVLAGSSDMAWITFTRTTTIGDLTVKYTVGGTAVAGSDYEPLSGAVVIPDGETQAAVAVHPVANPGRSGDTYVEVSVRPGDGYDVGSGAPADVLIQDPSAGEPILPASGTAGAPSAGGWSSKPVRYWDGKVWYQTADLESDGFGGPWGVARSWSNLSGYSNDAYMGSGWVDVMAPRLLKANIPGSPIVLIQGGDQSTWFSNVSGNYVSQYFTTDQLSYDSSAGEFDLTDGSGNRWTFFDPGNTALPALQRGQFKTFTDPYGNVTHVVGWRTDGKPTEVQRSVTVGGTTTTESFLYTYMPGGTNDGLLASVTLRRQVGAGSWTAVRKVDYTYYDGTTSNGNAGDLEYATVKDGGGTALTTEYYRYWTTTGTGGYVHGLKYAFRPDSYARLAAWAAANSTTVPAATDSQVAPFADHYFEYVGSLRAAKEVAKGAGSSAGGGLGTFTFSYTLTTGSPSGIDDWNLKTVETLPDGNQNIVYTNRSGGVLLSSFKEVATGNQWITYNHYNSAGQVDWTADPSAVTGYDDSHEDLLNFSLGASPYLRDDAGVFQLTDYYSSTTATASSAGGVTGYLQDTKLRQGELGTPVLQETVDYVARTSGGTTIYLAADDTQYRNTDGTGGQTVRYGYAWGTGFGPQSVTVTQPAVTTSENGSGTVAAVTTVFDSYGNAVWFKDADGYLHYRAYDIPTGAVTKSIEDVDTTQTSTFTGLPTGWSTPTGGGLHLTTTGEVDALGRTTAYTDPNGNVTYYVFDDADHALRTYPGWNTSTNTPTGPTIVAREDWADGYSETLTMSATPTVSGGRPTGAEGVSNVQTLSRDYYNAGGQLVNQDEYYDLSGLTYNISTSLGTEGTNFNRIRYGYNATGLPDRMASPAGTIYRTWHDALGRVVSEWVGLDDTPTSGTWSPTNTAGTDLVETSADVYDGGGVGDGNLTRTTDYPGGGAPARESDFYYDWRDRVVAVKDGVETSESTSVNRPIQYFDLDNLGEVTQERTYDGDGVTLTTTGGVPQPPSSSLLRAQVVHSYDELGQEYRTQVYSVDPSTGGVSSTALTTNAWFDNRGNTIKLAEPGGLVTKDAYDGAGRPTTEYLTDGGGDSGYSDAANVTGDTVLTQAEWTYDANGNPILVTTRDRFHDATGTGALGTPTSGVPARVSYGANYFDAADRLTASVDVGTNGGSAYTRPSSVPSPSDTTLVTSYGYNAAGWVSDETDPLGILNKTYYDAAGRVTKTIQDYTTGTPSNSSDKTVEYTYNPNGSPATIKADLTGGGSETTAYVYGVTTSGGSGLNSNDVLAAVEHPDPSTGAASSSQQDTDTVNALGDPLTKTDRNGTVHTYTYDSLGRLTADAVTTLGTGVDGSVRRIEIAYDGQGNPSLMTSYDAAFGGSVVNQVEQDFNGLGQLTSDWQEHAGAVTGSTPRVQYAYSEMPGGANHSRPTSMTYPNGKVLTFNYATGLNDAISRLSSLSDSTGTLESYDYLGLDTVVRQSRPQIGIDLTYIKQSGESTGDAGDQYTGLDRFGRVVDQRWLKTSTGTATDRFQYGYDRNGKPLWRDDLVNPAFGELYAYDGLSQQTSFQRGTLNSTKTGLTGSPSRSQSWALDAVGNFTSQTSDGTTQTRMANKQNEITSVSGATTPTYDADGNLTTDEAGHTYRYDAWGRLVQVKDAGGATLATFAYDGLDRRVSETHGSATTDLYYSDQGQVVEERVGGTPKVQYVWSPVYVNALILRDRDADGNSANGLEERLWVEQDADWNVTALVDGSGTVVERYAYDAFGGVTVMDGSWSVRTGGSAYAWAYLWQGERLDAATGMYKVGYRDVSPTLGRALEPDPMGFAAGDVNVYRWEGNMPRAAVDPTGLSAIPISGVWFGTPQQQIARFRTEYFAPDGVITLKDPRWYIPDDDITVDPDPAIYGAGNDENLRRSELGEAILEDLNRFAEHMEQYALEQALLALLGPVFAKAAAAAMKGGWKLIKVGGKYLLKKGDKICTIGCFAAGTPIRTPGGDKPIEELKPGDLVLARAEDDSAAPVQARVVEDVFQRLAAVVGIMVGGQTLSVTEEHPIYTQGRGWTPAHELRAGDWVLGERGEWLPIGRVEPAREPVLVYNMCVAEAHTFLVGGERWGFAVWVHNALQPHGPCPRGLRGRMGDPPSKMTKPEAHHDLPQKFRDRFERRGIDIDDPQYGRWVEGSPVGRHQNWSAEFNREWEDFFRRNPNASKADILEFMRRLQADPRFQ
jgi:RHS repeat-associated protein